MAADAQSGFPTTDWSLLRRAQHGGGSQGREPLAELIGRYVPAIRRYLVRVRRVDRDRADDLIQSFVTDKLLNEALLRAADQRRGRLRNLLVRALEHYLISAHRRERSRGTGSCASGGKLGEQFVADNAPEPIEAFELEWAKSVLQEAVQRTFAHYQRRRRDDLWQVLRCRIVDPAADGVPVPPYKELVERFGFATPSEASNALISAKRTFMRKLAEVLAEHAGDGADPAEELADLKRIICR